VYLGVLPCPLIFQLKCGKGLEQKKFTDCEAVREALESYKINSNTVSLFLQEKNYIKSPKDYVQLKQLYIDYRVFCYEGGYTPVNKGNFVSRLKNSGILIGHKNIGNVVYIETALA
jgi:putative DNA primase/helicase